MGDEPRLTNRVREARERRGWTQDELARRSGLSRAGISAIENGRLVPSTAASLTLASTFETSVEDLFTLAVDPGTLPGTSWAWPAPRPGARYWKAEVAGRVRAYPNEPSALGVLPPDGISRDGAFEDFDRVDASRSLVLASCDPAAGILATELARAADLRLIVLTRSSRKAIELMGRGLAHVAGVHLARADESEGNIEAVRRLVAELGTGLAGCQLLRVADWDEGIAVSPSVQVGTIRQAIRHRLRWVAREPGSGARQCLDEVLGSARGEPRSRIHGTASDHRGVATAVRDGWADAGICLRLTGEEAGLDFLGVRREAYDLCFADSLATDPRIRALIRVVRSPSYRRLIGSLPGYDVQHTGELVAVRRDACLPQPPVGPA